ncbi:putative 3'-5' exonuclease related to the exonuclease domain of PolB [bacterium BMS3Abin04]|nr:putative 3'-5' exonuclease related to the exonuclease domain of PolB [bacterium BMS3Abin04]
MKRLVFDIETSGYEFEDLSSSQQEYLLRYASKEKDETIMHEKIDEAKRYLSLYPFTAKVISIGMLNINTEGASVLFEGKNEDWAVEEKKISYKALTEQEMIETFWSYVSKVDQVITFNGRSFDIPFLMLRSAILKIKPSVNLIQNRYNLTHHVDLLDQFTLYGLIRKFNLDFYCHAFGIESPKSKGVSGMDVKELYKAGRVKDIAIYCGEDVKATYELYKIWESYLNI